MAKSERRYVRRAACHAILLVGLAAALGGCTYTIEPLKGQEGKTYVYAAVGKDGAPNAGIITTSLGAVVIDPPLSPEIGQRLDQDALRMSKTFWDEKWRLNKDRKPTLAPPVLYALNTTFRASHSFGNQAFHQAADIIATERAGARLADLNQIQRMRELLKTQFQVPGLEMHAQALTQPTITFEGTMTLRTPEVEIKLISVGDCVGPGDCVIHLPQQKVLFAGDLVLVGFMPYHEGRTRSVRHWIKALQDLQKLDLDVVVPGHGATGGKDLLKEQERFLSSLVAQVALALKEGKSLEQAMNSVKLPNAANWRYYNEWLPGNVKLVYEELSQGPTPEPSAASANGASTSASMAMPAGVEGADPFRDR
ncbi:MAG: MBL fold metallo-hydrolase [Planctomycetota bacterium]|nr:MBL fold metallo-hydrolase [Planctomycetota bacterium]